VDPVSHALCGLTLVNLDRSGHVGTSARIAAIAGALAPDSDVARAFSGWDRYLVAHQAGTHSIAGALACAVVVTLACRAVTRTSARVLLAAALAGALSHIALDVLSGATIRLFWPVWDVRFSAPLVAMADPWLAGTLVLGTLASISVRRRSTMALTTVVVIVALLAIKAVVLGVAWRVYEARTAHDTVQASLAEAEWGSLTTWFVNDRTASDVRRWRVDAFSRSVVLQLSRPTAEATLGPRSRQLETVRNLLRSHDFAFGTSSMTGGLSRLSWSDIRYCWDPQQSKPPIEADTVLRPTTERVACGLWFGGTIGASGAPTGQFVSVGPYLQSR
jgi:membrane-bound metal-dependent hydrolase YbcI (DUF457 family)